MIAHPIFLLTQSMKTNHKQTNDLLTNYIVIHYDNANEQPNRTKKQKTLTKYKNSKLLCSEQKRKIRKFENSMQKQQLKPKKKGFVVSKKTKNTRILIINLWILRFCADDCVCKTCQ